MHARPASPADAAEVLRLARLMFDSMGIDSSDAGWQRNGERHVQERLGRDLAVFVIDHPDIAGRLVASAAGTISVRLPVPWNQEGRIGYVQWVATEPASRRQGLGRKVMDALLEWYRTEGVPVVELHATALGEPMYRSLGFTESAQPALRRRTTPAC